MIFGFGEIIGILDNYSIIQFVKKIVKKNWLILVNTFHLCAWVLSWIEGQISRGKRKRKEGDISFSSLERRGALGFYNILQ